MNSIPSLHFARTPIAQEVFRFDIPHVWEKIFGFLLSYGNGRAIVQFACSCQEAQKTVAYCLKSLQARKANAFKNIGISHFKDSVSETSETPQRVVFAGKDFEGCSYFLHRLINNHCEIISNATGLVTLNPRNSTQMQNQFPKDYLQNEGLKIDDVEVKAVIPFEGGLCYLTTKGIYLFNASGHHVVPDSFIEINSYASFDNILFFSCLKKSISQLEYFEFDLLASEPQLIPSKRLEGFLKDLLPADFFNTSLKFSFYSSGQTLFIVSKKQIIEVEFNKGKFQKIAEHTVLNTLNAVDGPDPCDIAHRANHSWLACLDENDEQIIVFKREKDGLRKLNLPPIDFRYEIDHIPFFQLQDDFLLVADICNLRIIHLPTEQVYFHTFEYWGFVEHARLDFCLQEDALSIRALLLTSVDENDDPPLDSYWFHTITFSKERSAQQDL